MGLSTEDVIIEGKLVQVGHIAGLVPIVIAASAAQPLLGGFNQAFLYIQDCTGFFTPGNCAVFNLGLLWKGAIAIGAPAAAIATFTLSRAALLRLPDAPFMDRVRYVFLACCASMVMAGLLERRAQPKAIALGAISFRTSLGYNRVTAIVLAMLGVVYTVLW